MTRVPGLGLALLVSLAPGCTHVETAPGLELTPAVQTLLSGAVDTAAFWAPSCDRRQIIVQRVDDTRSKVELSVCGTLRRYQCIWGERGCAAWLDVTQATGTGSVPAS